MFGVGDAPLTGLDWSPAGDRIAGVRWTPFRHERDSGHRPGIPAPNVKVIRRLRYKQDRIGFMHDRYSQVWVLELPCGDLVQVTDSECDYSEPSWSGSGDRLAFIGLAREQNGALGQGQIFVCAYPGVPLCACSRTGRGPVAARSGATSTVASSLLVTTTPPLPTAGSS